MAPSKNVVSRFTQPKIDDYISNDKSVWREWIIGIHQKIFCDMPSQGVRTEVFCLDVWWIFAIRKKTKEIASDTKQSKTPYEGNIQLFIFFV